MQRLVFMGSPELAVPTLMAAAGRSDCLVVGVFTQPERRAGRGRRLQLSPVGSAAEELGIPLFSPEKIREPEALESLRGLAPGLVIVCAYGQLLPDALLELPPLGCYNLHFSLLPRWRGASPIQAALLAGDGETGVSLQRMVQKLDAGPIVAESPPLPIQPADTAQTLGGRLAEASAGLLSATLPLLLGGAPPIREQEASRATFCRTIRKAAGGVDWEAESAGEIERKVRAYTPWPGCFSMLGSRRLGLIRVVEATGEEGRAAAEQSAAQPGTPEAEAPRPGLLLPGGLVRAREGWLRLLEVKPEGKGAMPLRDFLNGYPGAIGSRLTRVE